MQWRYFFLKTASNNFRSLKGAMQRRSVRTVIVFWITLSAFGSAFGDLPTSSLQNTLKDRYGDPLPSGGVARLGSLRFWHGSYINSLAYSPDGRILASGEGNGEVRIWDAGTGQQLRIFSDVHTHVTSITFSPDGKTLVSAGDSIDFAWTWRLPDWAKELLERMLGERVTLKGKVVLWDVTTGRVQQQIRFKHDVRGVGFSNGGKTLAILSGDKVHLWDLDQNRELKQITSPPESIDSFAFSPNDKMMATAGAKEEGNLGVIRLWELGSGKVAHFEVPEIAQGDLESIAFSPDGRLLALSSGRIHGRLWDVSGGKEVRQLLQELNFGGIGQAAPNGSRCMIFSPDGKSLASDGGVSLEAVIWDVASGKKIHTLDHERHVLSVDFSPDGKTLATGGDGHVIRFWDVASGRELRRFMGHRASVRAVAYSHDGKTFASAGMENVVCLWDSKTHQEIRRIEVPRWFGIRAVAYSPDDIILAIAGEYGENDVILWDLRLGRERSRLACEGGASSLAFSRDGRLLVAAGHSGMVHLWEVKSNQQLWQIPHWAHVNSIAFSPDGKILASAGNDRIIRVWDAATGKSLKRLIHGDPMGVVLDPTETKNMWSAEDEIRCVTFSSDGKLLASGGGDHCVRIWDLETDKPLRQLQHIQAINSIAFSSNGRSLASGSDDGTSRLWEIESGRELRVFKHLDAVRTVVFSRDGVSLATGSDDTTVMIWKVPD